MIAELARKREHDGRLVEITYMVGNEKDRPSKLLQVLSALYLQVDKVVEQRIIENRIHCHPDTPDTGGVGPEPEMLPSFNLFTLFDNPAQLSDCRQRPDEGVFQIETVFLLNIIDQLQPRDGGETQIGNEA